MHLFYNVGKDMLRLWCGGGGEGYVLGRCAIREIDAELQAFGDGIASEVGARPRLLSRFKDWKSSEIKAFILHYSLVVLDGYLSEPYLSGWRSFVELVDICWRPVLTQQDITDVGRLAREFYENYEEHYYKYDEDRMNLCKYVFHLLLHLEEGIRECGTPVGYSQYWIERYIGWIVGRLQARNRAADSLFRGALFGEAYKMYFNVPFSSDVVDYEDFEGDEGFQMHGRGYMHCLCYDSESDMRFLGRLKKYFMRKYDGLTAAEADNILDGVDSCVVKPRLRFHSGSGTQTASSYYGLRQWDGSGENSV